MFSGGYKGNTGQQWVEMSNVSRRMIKLSDILQNLRCNHRKIFQACFLNILHNYAWRSYTNCSQLFYRILYIFFFSKEYLKETAKIDFMIMGEGIAKIK